MRFLLAAVLATAALCGTLIAGPSEDRQSPGEIYNGDGIVERSFSDALLANLSLRQLQSALEGLRQRYYSKLSTKLTIWTRLVKCPA